MNVQIQEEAAEWLVEFRVDTVDAAARERFAAWLRKSPEHVRAYLELVAFWEDAGAYDAGRNVDVDTLVALARSETNIVALEPTAAVRAELPPGARPSGDHRKCSARRWLPAVAALAAVVTAAAVGFQLFRDPGYRTEVGEQRIVTLEDGSSVELNALSHIRVHFTDRERIVHLLAGQALFRVAQNKTRPFVVVSDNTRVRALATQFDVRRKPSGLVVTVIEGRVAVGSHVEQSPDAAPSPLPVAPLEITAGEQVTVGSNAPAEPTRANLSTATAWTQKLLVFESAPLPEVAEEFNRFNGRKLVIRGAALTDFHVSGTFPALDPASLLRLLRFLRDQPGIEVEESGDRIIITMKQG
jgi:transmembrane sensor